MKEKIRNSILILLLLLPIAVLNNSYSAISKVKETWLRDEQERFAEQKLEEIASNIDFTTQMARYGNKFIKSVKYLPENNKPIVKDIVRKTFEKPFPTHEVFVFEANQKKTSLLCAPKNFKGSKTAYKYAFSHLFKISRLEKQKSFEKRRNEKILKKLFGELSISKLIGLDQRGVATYVLYKHDPSLLLWDYTKQEEGKYIGYFLIVSRSKNNLEKKSCMIGAKLAGLGRKLSGGFLSIYKSGSTDHYFPADLKNDSMFQKWRAKLGYCEKEIKRFEKSGFPWKKLIKKRVLFTRILPGKHHIAFLLLPAKVINKYPPWLFTLNILLLAFVILTWSRGMILCRWLLTDLKYKFLYIYLISLVLPAGLYVTSAYVYMFETSKAEKKQTEELLEKELFVFEASKELIDNEYLKRLNNVVKDKKIEKELKLNGIKNKKVILDEIGKCFYSKNSKLPLDFVSVISLDGNNIYKSYSKSRSDKVKQSINFFTVGILELLRKNLSLNDKKFKLPEYKPNQLGVMCNQAYETKDRTLAQELEKFRGRVFRFGRGGSQQIYYHQYISINGKYRYVLLASWRDQDTASMVVKKIIPEIYLRNPNIKLSAFTKNNNIVKPLLKPDRSVGPLLFSKFRLAAESNKQGVSRVNDRNYTIVSLASTKFANIILLAAVSNEANNRKSLIRALIFLVIGVIAIIITILASYITYFRSVVPLRILKNSLDNVGEGNLNFNLETKRNDEIGLLTSEFSTMVSGLSERERLSSIISDQAISVISNSEKSNDSNLSCDNFTGVVLITDIRDFTTLCETNDTSVITKMLNEHFTQMSIAISENGGKIYKYIGDAIEAVFVDDGNGAECVERALNASLEMFARLKRINSNRLNESQFEYKMGIGLSYGEIMSGPIGSVDSRLDYALLSETFKKAESLEALTKSIPGSPILLDESVMKRAQSSKYSFSQLEEYDAYSLSDFNKNVGDKSNDTFVKAVESANVKEGSDEKPVKNTLNRSKYYRFLTFLFGFICTSIPFIVWIQSEYMAMVDYNRNERKIAVSRCNEFKNKLKSDASPLTCLDEYINTRIDELVNKIPANKVSKRQLIKVASKFYNDLKASNIHPTVFLACIPPNSTDSFKEYKQKHVAFMRLSGDRIQYESEYKELMAIFNYRMSPLNGHAVYSKKIEEFGNRMLPILGSNPAQDTAMNMMYARLFPIKLKGKSYYLYWKFLTKWNSATRNYVKSIRNAAGLFQKYAAKFSVNAGSVLFILPADCFEKSFTHYILYMAEKSHLEFNLVSLKTKKSIHSKAFPKLFNGKKWVKSNVLIDLNKSGKALLQIAVKLKLSNKTKFLNKLFLVLGCLIGLLVCWYYTVFEERVISSKFAIQLWVGLLAAASLPLSTVFMINEWYAQEQIILSPKEKRIRMLNYLDEIERREFLKETIHKDTKHLITFDKKINKWLHNLKKKPSKQLQEKVIKRINLLSLGGKRTSVPLIFNEITYSSKYDWNFSIYKNKRKKDDSFFRTFVTSVCHQYFEKAGSKNPELNSPKNMAALAKEDILKESGFKIIQILFGNELYFQLAAGLGLEAKVFAPEGFAYLQLIPYPSMINPDLIAYWQKTDGLNGNCRNISRSHDKDYGVFVFKKNAYGDMTKTTEVGFFTKAIDLARWSHAMKSPISSEITFANKKYLVEVKNGNLNYAMTMMVLSDKGKILSKIKNLRNDRLSRLMFALLIILIFSVISSYDINSAVLELTKGVARAAKREYWFRITASRKDELGQLYISFNKMMRGLEEKETMETMVSKTARKAMSDETGNQKAKYGFELNVVVMYIMVPGFEYLLDCADSSNLLRDLQLHIAQLSKIILENGGDIDKLMGEKILAVFYDPEGLKKSKKLALAVAHKIVEAELKGGLKFPVAIGIHSGAVIAGLLGAGKNRDFTIIGDTVNTTARIASKSALLPYNRVLVSDDFKQGLTNVGLRQHGEVELKGKAEKVALFQLT